jgi:trimeric autotransporter adhesin
LRGKSGHFWLRFALVAVVLAGCSDQQNYPTPYLTSLSPPSILAGQPAFNLTVIGSGFTPQSTVLWDGTARITIFNSTTSMTAQILSTDIQNAGQAMIKVTTPTPGGGTTLPVTFTINAGPSPVPQISSLTPSGATTGTAGLSLTVTGTNFVSLATVTVNGNARRTAYEDATTLVADVLASDLAQAGTLAIGVINPQPAGGNSNSVSFTVNNPTPGLLTVTPNAFTAGSLTTPITVGGSGFVSTSVVTINGSPRITAFSSATQLQAKLTQGDLSAAGVYVLGVTSPGPGGGNSNTMTVAVNGTPITGLPVILDLAPNGAQANNGVCAGSCTGVPTLQTAGPSVNDNGQFVAFASDSTNLVLNQVNPVSNIFVRNTCLIGAGTPTTSTTCSPSTLKLTQSVSATDANGPSSQPTIDSAGAHVAYTSTATNLVVYVAVSGTTRQVYWQATCSSGNTNTGCTGTMVLPALVSVAADGLSAGNGDSYDPVISPDGQYVAFVSLATNLVSNVLVDGVTPQVYIYNTCNLVPPATGTCAPTAYLVSTKDGTTPANAASSSPTIANDGLFVAFVSKATNLGATAANSTGASEVFVRSTCVTTIGTEGNTCAPATTLGSTPDGTTPADGASIEPTISGDGRFVAFASTATNLAAGVGPTQQIYVRDTCTGVESTLITSCSPSTQLVSTPDGKTPANALSESPSINNSCSTTTAATVPCATGQYIAFASLASNLGANVQNGIENVFTRDTCNGVSTVIEVATTLCAPYTFLSSQPGGTSPPPASGSSVAPALSGDGHSVSFISSASNLVANDTHGLPDVFQAATNQVFTLVLTLLGKGSGTVTDASGQIDCAQTAATSTTPLTVTGTCVGSYISGSTVTLTASAGTGYLFTVWGGTAPSVPNASCTATTSTGTTAGSSTTGSCTFSIIENNTASATFP